MNDAPAADPASGPEPVADRPHVPEYGIPTDLAGLLPWGWATERLTTARQYWLATAGPDGRPHVIPIWGAWTRRGMWFEGGLRTRYARNLDANPLVVVTLERERDVVILEGVATRIAEPDADLDAALVRAFAKYIATDDYRVDPANWRVGGLWRVTPVTAFGWSDYPADATRWRFPAG